MTAHIVIRARVSKLLKRQAASVLAPLGLTVSDVMRMLLAKIVRDQTLPADLIPNALTADTLRKSARGEDVHYPKDAATLFKELGIQCVFQPIPVSSKMM